MYRGHVANADQPEVTDLILALRDEMRERFDGVDRRFDHVDQELHQIKVTVGAIRIETSALIDTVADMNKRTDA